MSEQGSTTKMCVLCHESVAGKPRHKDARGRYFCDPCFARAKEHASRKKAAKIAGARSMPGGGGADSLDPDEPDLTSIREESVAPIGLREQRVCSKCDQPLMFDAVVCTGCGFNRLTGQTSGTSVIEVEEERSADSSGGPTVVLKQGGLCGKCGYNLSKGKGLRCPECGTLNRVSSKRDEYAEDSRRAARAAYIKPAIFTVIGIAGVAIILAVREHTAMEVLGYTVYYAVMFLAGLAVYFLSSITWLGVDEPFHLMTLRLLAVFCMTDLVETLTEEIPIWFLKIAMVIATHVIALVTLMEIDIEDAWIVALLTLLARAGVFLTVVFFIAQRQ